MKKLTTIIFALLFTLLLSTPSMANLWGADVDVDICNKNTNTNINANTNKNTNINANTNVNTNKNTNTQGQMQGQVQGQAQKNELTIIEAETKREHLTPPNIVFAPLGTYAESANHGSEMIKFSMLTKFKKNYSYEHAVEHYGKAWGKGKCITAGGSYNGRHEDDPTKSIEIVNSVDLNKVVPIGILTVKANPKYKKDMVTSFVILQKTVASACIMQGTKIMFIDEGATTKAENSGWGIGWNGSGGIINDMDNRGRSASSSAGMGYSKGGAWLRTLPWLTVYVFKDK